MTASPFSFEPRWRWLGWILVILGHEAATEAVGTALRAAASTFGA